MLREADAPTEAQRVAGEIARRWRWLGLLSEQRRSSRPVVRVTGSEGRPTLFSCRRLCCGSQPAQKHGKDEPRVEGEAIGGEACREARGL